MNFIFRKFRNIYKRLENGFQVTVFPEKFSLYPKLQYLHHNLSYSQEGEDMILSRFFENKENGFYVDVGAHHPQRFSNTYLFYMRGWRGINIDAMPGSMESFNKIRVCDINLEFPISDGHQTLTYYEFNEPALNGFCRDISMKRNGSGNYRIISEKKMKTYTLSEILDNYLPNGQNIDFLTIDVEGLDLQVLKSNNWHKYRPHIVLLEDLNRFPISQIHKSDIASFMEKQNYHFYAKSIHTLFFLNKN
ncbi:MAG: FkbM family methyltransferase [Coleofasciculus chthonoplastes F3-SA18-01]|uniref:FkbM family methyltransferase n=1 Tax=Coleofasciculus chthonoplastes TaxID=64178 RepID=UPI0032FD3EC3